METKTAKSGLFLFAVNTELNNGDELIYVQAKFPTQAVKQFEGCYKGEIVPSYGVFFSYGAQFQTTMQEVKKLATFHRQESFLSIDAERIVHSYEEKTKYTLGFYRGELISVSYSEAQKHEGCTRNPATDACWVVQEIQRNLT